MATPSETDEQFLDRIIDKLRKNKPKDPAPMTGMDIKRLTTLAAASFQKQKTLIDITGPISICGDVHGQYFDLLQVLNLGGWPPATRYLFLGDYVDRGPRSVEVISLLMAYKVRYPDDFYLLRGNHETLVLNKVHGFHAECLRRYSLPVWHAFNEVFSTMPLCALVDGRVFCMHGGVPRYFKSFDWLRSLQRPLEIPDEGILCDLLWADPDSKINGWDKNDRGCSYVFGADVVTKFCTDFDIDLVVRAHQVVQQGFELFANRHLVTVFSAPNYTGTYTNAAGIITIDENLSVKFKILQPPSSRRPDDQSTVEDEATAAGPVVAGGFDVETSTEVSQAPRAASTKWISRSLLLMGEMFETNGFHEYHPGQPNLPRRWYRTTIRVGQAHLSYRNADKPATIEISVFVPRDPPSIMLTAHVGGHSTPVECKMEARPEYEQLRGLDRETVLRDYLATNFFSPIMDLQAKAKSSKGSGRRKGATDQTQMLNSKSEDSGADSEN